MKRWFYDESITGDNTLIPFGSPIYHSHWITAVFSLPRKSHPNFPDGAIISSCMDNAIRFFDDNNNMMLQLVGHEKSAISFSWTPDFNLISGSWDGTARLWNLFNGQCISVFGGHENGVHVLCLENNLLATVSTGEQIDNRPANFKLRMWSIQTAHEVRVPIVDHQGPIRSIFPLPNVGFITTSNDGTVKFRSISGEAFLECSHNLAEEGYPPFVLDGCVLPTPDQSISVVTCGEDGSVMLWNGTDDAVQSLPHPTCVWAVIAQPTSSGHSNFITAGHDGFLRVFSRNRDMLHTTPVKLLMESFEIEVEEMQRKKHKGVSAEDLAKAPRWENRHNNVGKSEGAVSVFNKDGKLIAAQWSDISKNWIEIGEVTSSSDGGDVQGVVYDHVIPVEIETANGLVELKLGYNNLENPFNAAQRFIEQNNLGQHYLNQIANFILARKGPNAGPTLDMSSAGTGAGAGPSLPPRAQTPQHVFEYIPLKTYFYFDEVAASVQTKLLPKIIEINSTSPNGASLTDLDIQGVREVVSVVADTSHYHSSQIRSNQLSGLVKMVFNWPHDQSFPAFDLLRLVAFHPSGGTALLETTVLPQLLQHVIVMLNSDATAASASSLTSLRFLCNIFKSNTLLKVRHQFILEGTRVSQDYQHSLCNAVKIFIGSSKKTHRNAAIVLLMNIIRDVCVIMEDKSNAAVTIANIFPILVSILKEDNFIQNELESILNSLIAIGTAGYHFKDFCTQLALVESLGEALQSLRAVMQSTRYSNAVLASSVSKCLQEVSIVLSL